MESIDTGIDLRALRALVAITDSGSFRAAAAAVVVRPRRAEPASPPARASQATAVVHTTP